MAIYPGALQRPLTVDKARRALTVVNRVNLHVAVAETTSLHGAFNRKGEPDSHFYVRRDGGVEQYVDTSMRANADLEGNDATISVETQGGLEKSGPDTEPWTPEQREALAKLYAWAVIEHGVARRLATSSQLGDASKGLSWHRLGVDGNFPDLPDIRAGRLQRGGGMRYSTARGKLCPGAGKIGQIPGIFERAIALLDGAGGGAAVVTPPAPTPEPAPAPAPSGLVVDGTLGPATVRRWQQVMGTPVDGVISRRSQLIMAVQRHLIAHGHSVGKAGVDGTLGPATIRALQSYMGTPVDGVISRQSQLIMAIQRRLNDGTF